MKTTKTKRVGLTSRRTFLKTGAAAAGAALLGAPAKATPSSATDQAQGNLEKDHTNTEK